mmetsp:Transcript_48203/g.146584  ORF Transcript_48203/g.146584 Transcript_48203/m.146584 type:complete len:200 (-) Transcript_48203:506-1105(-)
MRATAATFAASRVYAWRRATMRRLSWRPRRPGAPLAPEAESIHDDIGASAGVLGIRACQLPRCRSGLRARVARGHDRGNARIPTPRMRALCLPARRGHENVDVALASPGMHLLCEIGNPTRRRIARLVLRRPRLQGDASCKRTLLAEIAAVDAVNQAVDVLFRALPQRGAGQLTHHRKGRQGRRGGCRTRGGLVGAGAS